MVLHCPVLSCMVLYGLIWSCVGQYGPVYSCLVLYGPVLSLLVLYGLLWSCMVPFSSVCSSMDQYGPVWSCMVPYGVVKLKSSSLVMTQLWVIISFNSSPDRCLRILNQAGKGSNMPNKEYCLNQPYFFILNIKKL